MNVKNHRKSIAITGANGFIAKNLRKKLSYNYDLVSFSRTNFVSVMNETKVITNYNESELAFNLKNCDILVHLIGIGKQHIDSEFDNINSKITSHLIQTYSSTKVKKIIYLSGLDVSPKNTSSYFISKFKAEQYIIHSGFDYTIFRPSYIIGKNDYLTKSLNSQIKKGQILIPGSGKYLLQPILVSDVIDILENSFYNKKFCNKIIDLVGPEKIPFEKYIKLFSKGKNVKFSKIPLEDCIKNALTNSNYVYNLDDISILLGEFIGNFKKLNKIYANTIKPVSDFL